MALTPFAIIIAKISNGKISPAKVIEKMTKILGKSSKLANSKLSKKYLNGVRENIEYTIKNTSVKAKPIGTILNGVNLYEGKINENTKKLLKNIKLLPDELAKYDEIEIRNFWSDIKKTLTSTNMSDTHPIMKTVDKLTHMSKDEQLKELRAIISKTDIKNIDELLEHFGSFSIKTASLKIKSIAELITPEALKKKLNSEYIFNELKSKVEKMSNEEFNAFIEKYSQYANIKGLDKGSAINILSNVSTAIKNMPSEEINKILAQCSKSFNEHPDEFIKLVKNGKIMSLFKTPALENALAIAGISWVAFSMVVTYAIESWLADIQLKAGRLGVMKSLEELDDIRYYANIEQPKQL